MSITNTNLGSQSTFVDTQKSNLARIFPDTPGEGDTTNEFYIQITDLVMDLDSKVTKHQLTDDTIDNVFSLYMSSVQGNMWVTTGEWADLVTLTIDVNGVRPINAWTLDWTDQSTDQTTNKVPTIATKFNAQMKTLRPIDSGIGAVKLFFRLEFTESVEITLRT